MDPAREVFLDLEPFSDEGLAVHFSIVSKEQRTSGFKNSLLVCRLVSSARVLVI